MRGMKYPLNRDFLSSKSGEIVAFSGNVGIVGVKVFDKIVWRCRLGEVGEPGLSTLEACRFDIARNHSNIIMISC